MESKNDDNDAVTEIAESQAPAKNVIVRFVEYSFHILNNEMDEFFDDHMEAFNQDLEDLTDGRGETLEQYNIYQKYLSELESYFDEFASREGYESSSQCFDEINSLIVNDEIERKKLFKEMSERMMAAFSNLQEQMEAVAQGEEDNELKDDGKKGADDDEDVKGNGTKGEKASAAKSTGRRIKDAKDDDEDADDAKTTEVVSGGQGNHSSPAPPVIMFFQPVSLDSMLQHVLSLTEYTTFSYIIRTKLKQKQLYHSLLARVEKQNKQTAKRTRKMERGEPIDDLYEELVQRICDFAPNQTQFQNQIRSHLDIKSWKDLLATSGSDHAPPRYYSS
jgi:hypothetical protein